MPMIPANHTYLDTLIDAKHSLREYWEKKGIIKE